MVHRPSTFQVWLQAARPKTLWAGVAPVLIGTALASADGGFHAGWAFAALVFSLLMQVGSNFCNDYADFKKGADTEARTGPLRVTQAGWVAPDTMARATILVFGLGVLLGVTLALRVHGSLVAVVALAAACGVLYTAGPVPLGYVGLGDVLVFTFFGPVAVVGTYAVQTLHWTPVVLAHSVPPGLLAVAILAVNNLRDRDTDARAGKRTLAVRFGANFVRMEYLACVLGAAAIPILLHVHSGEAPWTLLTLFLLPAAWRPVRSVLGAAAGAGLNPVLGETARLLLLYAVLLSMGLILSP